MTEHAMNGSDLAILCTGPGCPVCKAIAEFERIHKAIPKEGRDSLVRRDGAGYALEALERVCAWHPRGPRLLGPGHESGIVEGPVQEASVPQTHGMCEACHERVVAEASRAAIDVFADADPDGDFYGGHGR